MSETVLRPEHVGEPLVVALLGHVANEKRLNKVMVYSPKDRTGISLSDVLSQRGISNPTFHDNVQLSPIKHAERSYAFDGLSRIDCLIRDQDRGVAVEVKLGTERMTTVTFEKRFFKPSGWSKHVPPKIKGNMISILDGRFSQSEFADAPLCAVLSPEQKVSVADEWLLLVRQQVWLKWEDDFPCFRKDCRVLVFEELVPAVGGPEAFDRIVSQLVGGSFASVWKLVPQRP